MQNINRLSQKKFKHTLALYLLELNTECMLYPKGREKQDCTYEIVISLFFKNVVIFKRFLVKVVALLLFSFRFTENIKKNETKYFNLNL